MKIAWTALALALSIAQANACSITISMVTTTPAQNLSKTWTETDANCVLALQAVAATNPPLAMTLAQAALFWAQNAINQLITITTSYQRNNAAVTPINPQ